MILTPQHGRLLKLLCYTHMTEEEANIMDTDYLQARQALCQKITRLFITYGLYSPSLERHAHEQWPEPPIDPPGKAPPSQAENRETQA